MANKNNQESKINSNQKEISSLDKVAKKILTIIDPGYSDREILSSKDAKFQSIINRELDIAKGVSNGNAIDFVVSMKASAGLDNKMNKDTDTSSLFTKDIGDIFGYFQDIYKNKYLEIVDLKFISKFIPAIGEAVKTTLDSIVTSDDVSSTITRNLGLPEGLDSTSKNTIIGEIERIEKNEKLLKKLKNVVYKKALIAGNYYVYAISYSELFKEYEKVRYSTANTGNNFNSHHVPLNSNVKLKNNRDKGFNMKAKESSMFAMESQSIDMSYVTSALESSLSSVNIPKSEINTIKSNCENYLSNFTINNSPYLSEALEAADSLQSYKKAFKDIEIQNQTTVDGTKSMNGGPTGDEFGINDTYIKYVDSKSITPIKIFNEVIGYFHIHATPRKRVRNGMSDMQSVLFNSTNLTAQKRESVINEIVDSIADGIIRSFSPKFISENAEHKKMIADCIIANGIVDNDYNVQFIPAQYIVPFVINEDENGNGESILADSLFPAKLLLSLIICKMLTYMNKSGNRTIAHVFKGPIDTYSSNQIQRVLRMLQESNITFNDFLSTNSLFSKFTRDGNIQLPTARNGNKLIEFETQEGQQVDLKTDFEDKLEQMAILGTGVPSVIMEYVNQADFAKQIVSAHIKFAGHISSLQADLEESTTQLYKILIKNSSLDETLKKKCLNDFTFKLPRPRALANANNSDFLQTLMTTAQTVSDIYLGSQGNDDPNFMKKKDLLIREVVMMNAPFFDWNGVKNALENIELEIAKEKKPDEEVTQ